MSQMYMFTHLTGDAHPLHGGVEGAGEDKAVDALLQARDGIDLHKVALNRPQQAGLAHTLVLGVLALRMSPGDNDCQCAAKELQCLQW